MTENNIYSFNVKKNLHCRYIYCVCSVYLLLEKRSSHTIENLCLNLIGLATRYLFVNIHIEQPILTQQRRVFRKKTMLPKGHVTRGNFHCNLQCNGVALQVARKTSSCDTPCLQLVSQRKIALQVARTNYLVINYLKFSFVFIF